MRRYTLFVLFIFIIVTPSYGKEYRSSFGFTVDIPKHWIILTRQEIIDNPNLIEVNKNALNKIGQDFLDKVKSGFSEFYFYQNISNNEANINVLKQIGKVPKNDSQLREVCNLLPPHLFSTSGRKIRLYHCELKSVKGLASLYIEHDGFFEGTMAIQYQIQKSPNEIIAIGATCKNYLLNIIRKEFDKIVYSIKFD